MTTHAATIKRHLGDAPPHARVVVVDVTDTPTMAVDLTDEKIHELWEEPIQRVIEELQDAHAAGCTRMVVVTPLIGMAGAAGYSAQAAVAEAARIVVKSAARQWGKDGIVVNAVALDSAAYGIDEVVAGPVSIAPRAISQEVSAKGIVQWLCSDAAGDVTGQTFIVDGGSWM